MDLRKNFNLDRGDIPLDVRNYIINLKRENHFLEKQNKEKDKLFSVIAHDLRSPFTGFIGMTEVIIENMDKMTLGEIKEKTERLRDSAEVLYSLLENLLQWSLLKKNGKNNFQPEFFLIHSFVGECVKLIKGLAVKKNIELSIQIPENLEVYADVLRLKSVMCNLITNGIKFTQRKGRITISAKNVDDGSIQISVEDTGIGMDADVLQKLFIFGENIIEKGTENEPSTGLGLLLCKEFIENHKGKIWVESEKGKGSTFFFSLPPK